MPRSAESIARRREYTRRWWREHPHYQRKYQRRSRPGETTEMPPLHIGHPLFDKARSLTGISLSERDRTLIRRDNLIREDGLSEAVLALLEHKDPIKAWRQFRTKELLWIYRTCPFLIGEEDEE